MECAAVQKSSGHALLMQDYIEGLQSPGGGQTTNTLCQMQAVTLSRPGYLVLTIEYTQLSEGAVQ